MKTIVRELFCLHHSAIYTCVSQSSQVFFNNEMSESVNGDTKSLRAVQRFKPLVAQIARMKKCGDKNENHRTRTNA